MIRTDVNLLDPELFQRGGHHEVFRRLRADSPVSWHDHPDGPRLLEPPKHTRYRLLVNKGFTKRMIGLLEQYLRHRSTLIVDNIIERGACDFVEDLASELPLQAIAEIMGVPTRSTFDTTRSPSDHVVFGAGGPHFCLGANLARMGQAGNAQFLRSNFIGGIKHLPVAFTPGVRVTPAPAPAGRP